MDRFRAVECGDAEDRQTQHPEQGINQEPRPDDPAFLPCKPTRRIITHQPGRTLEFCHDLMARVDARRTTDAFHLQTVADIDSRRANLHAAGAVDACAGLGIGRFPTRLPPLFIITDYDGFVIGEGGLDASVGTEDDAELFPEMGEAIIESSGEEGDDSEDGKVAEGAVLHVLVQPGQGDEVG